jgi:hypothetical protein
MVWKVKYKAAVPTGRDASAKFKAWLDGIADKSIPPGTKPPAYEPTWEDVGGGEPKERQAFYEAESADAAKGMLLDDFRMCRTEVLGVEEAPWAKED